MGARARHEQPPGKWPGYGYRRFWGARSSAATSSRYDFVSVGATERVAEVWFCDDVRVRRDLEARVFPMLAVNCLARNQAAGAAAARQGTPDA